ncbi:hypothetical protein T4B_2572 [Trichinella pseudospiralis]|uniref:Uncharacterized protein n=1 Tax=Trichinella pseudospiralis TaxID=6337 RepID=A0A0V1H6W3_TRIPS|nr:hypothetical protein T4B_2572 [Trichinella pseudospiralis]
MGQLNSNIQHERFSEIYPDQRAYAVPDQLSSRFTFVEYSLADLCYYVNPDSSRKTCKYKHSSYRESVGSISTTFDIEKQI